METKIRSLTHPWNLSPKDAKTLQIQLSRRVVRESEINIENVTSVTGVDTHYQGDLSLAVAVTIRLPELETVECSTAVKRATFPYVSGLLAFREGPAILAALKNLTTAPELLMFDGHGIAHPRRCGLASHIGLLMDRPSIGCAKTLLSGYYDEPDTERGHSSPLKDGDDIIGAVVRSRHGVKPLFVSIGHRINLKDSISIVLRCCSRYRVPETMRQADQLARGELKHLKRCKNLQENR